MWLESLDIARGSVQDRDHIRSIGTFDVFGTRQSLHAHDSRPADNFAFRSTTLRWDPRVYRLNPILISSASGISTLFLELLYSHVLLFGRDARSQNIGASIKVDMDFVRNFQELYFPYGPSLHLQDFPIYASRLKAAETKMKDWRPRSVFQLATKPYNDPLAFYAFWFATFIGVLSILNLGATLAQTYASFKAVVK